MIHTRERLSLPAGAAATYFSLPLLEKRGIAQVERLPVSLRVLYVLEHVISTSPGRRTDEVPIA